MNIWLLVFVLFLKDGPIVVDHIYGDRFDCEVHMAAVADKVNQDKTIIGWKITDPCVSVEEASKL